MGHHLLLQQSRPMDNHRPEDEPVTCRTLTELSCLGILYVDVKYNCDLLIYKRVVTVKEIKVSIR